MVFVYVIIVSVVMMCWHISRIVSSYGVCVQVVIVSVVMVFVYKAL